MTAQTSPDLPDSLQRQTKPHVCTDECKRQEELDRHAARVIGPVLPDDDQPNSDAWKARCEQAWGQLDQAQADLAAMTARAESAEAEQWRAGYRAAVDEMRGVHQRTGSPAADWAAAYLDGQARYVAARHLPATGPLSASSATVSAPEQSTVVREGSEGQRGSEGFSEGAA